jgi:phospholipid/cholesterol/gamma-HCH transport system substrate-binding protein
MEAKVNYAAVGIFVMVLGVAFVAGILWLSTGGASRKAYDTYYAYMDESVSGLSLDAPVRYRGVEVGRVRKIALSDNVEQVQLTMSIARGTPVKEDTFAVMRMQGLTGIAFVELTGGRRDSPPLLARPGEDYPVIQSGPSLLTRLDSQVTALLTNLNQSSEHFNALMDENNRRALSRTLADLEVLSRTLAARSAAIDSGLANAARTMQNTARLTGEMSRLVERVQRSSEAFDRMAGELARAGTSASGTMQSTRETFERARAAIDTAGAQAQQFAAETLPEAQQLVTELRELTGSLRRFSEQVERNPSVLLYGRSASKRGPGE